MDVYFSFLKLIIFITNNDGKCKSSRRKNNYIRNILRLKKN